MNTPQFKEGDIVRLLPWSDFDISIPGSYWTELMDKDLVISNVKDDSRYDLILNGKSASCIYYNFKNHSYAWAEEFLKPSYTNFLTDKDFEI